MKYLITESQFLLLSEDIHIQMLKRRATYENMKKYIQNAEMEFPMLCDDFNDEFEFADNVISSAVNSFFTVDEDDFFSNKYDEYHDVIFNICKDWFGDYLLEIYTLTCTEE